MSLTIFTFSNILSFLRLALIPLLISAINEHAWMMAFCIFMIAAVSDVLDGELARRWNQQTKLGSYLDPFADKALTLSSYMALSQVPTFSSIIPAWFIWFIFIKELVLACGALSIFLIQGTSLKPTLLGKAAMVIQTSLIAVFLYSSSFHQVWGIMNLLVPLVMTITVMAGLHYIFLTLFGLVVCMIK